MKSFKKALMICLTIVIIVFSSCLSCFAVSADDWYSSSTYNSLTHRTFEFLLKSDSSNDKFIFVSTEINNCLYKNSSALYVGNCVGHVSYLTFTDGNFIINSGKNLNTTGICLTGYTIIQSNTTLYFDTGEVFFQPPTLLDKLLNPLQQTLEVPVVGNLGILAVFGVSCLACLVLLPLLLNIFRKFLT